MVTSTSARRKVFAAIRPPNPAPTITTRGRLDWARGAPCPPSPGSGSARETFLLAAADQPGRDQPIEGGPPRPTGQQEYQHSRPAQLLDPVLRIEEGRDHEDQPK